MLLWEYRDDADEVRAMEGRPCPCPTNEAGDIRCHGCGERVNVRCWNCGTPRGARPCPTITTQEEPMNAQHRSSETRIPSTPTDIAARYIRRIAAADYSVGDGTDVRNIEAVRSEDGKATIVLDLNDGTSIRLDIERYTR